ncbi:alkaline phosphatase D family protein [uncultured Draconibacterium sp.]|uniref:alkaline phosphatase D family protein n=1 Tax=uncultured Draconibacterium sp. TaxID=1573823 RepID=UPI0029C626E5|nr:alkaline phosphatase D family protein [uncultured Draconibacterium sp.]
MRKITKKLFVSLEFVCVQSLFLLVLLLTPKSYGQSKDTVQPRYQVTLPEAHVGNLEIDKKLLDSYELLPTNVRQFYFDARTVFADNPDAGFDHPKILESAQKHAIEFLGHPMLGNLKSDGVTVWLRPATSGPFLLLVKNKNGIREKVIQIKAGQPGVAQKVVVDELAPGQNYSYEILSQKQVLATGYFTTAPGKRSRGEFRLVFGSCFHKIGLHNPNLTKQILNRKPHGMLLLGDIAVDDRENNINMHRSDYLLRDQSKAWQQLVANVPVYTSWDDHDYLNNDLSGVPENFTDADRQALREVWLENWNNPENPGEGIYFNAVIGPVEVIMLDTRSCRDISKRGEYGAYIGQAQLDWLKTTLKNSDAPYKVITSGTMWSDYVSNGKDSWGTWDAGAREEIFSFIERNQISGVLLLSGDRHGARSFTIPRKNGHLFYEFEVATLGGVPGPDAMAPNAENQLFGYEGDRFIAFGEFTFNTSGEQPTLVFRLINQYGQILEEIPLLYDMLTPPGD